MSNPWGRLATEGDHFVCLVDGVITPWKWRGLTSFRLLEQFLRNDPIVDPWLDEAQALGANLVRVLSMKEANRGWRLTPNYSAADIGRFFDHLAARHLSCELTVFADTRAMMPSQADQLRWWDLVCEVARSYPHVVLELINEAGHPTQACDPQAFAQPDGILTSHGSGGEDQDVVHPYWSYVTYHGRRPKYDGDSRGFVTYSPYAWQELWPKPVPFINDEGPKPEHYQNDIGYARRIGEHAGCIAGGTAHTDTGITGDRLTAVEAACVREVMWGITRGFGI